ncbi:uncharacterized protein LOC126892466 [Diabrotica virgifera virgifera]|uniref:Uncharacterized protein n=1 Tax=Diabrotica virgifera virgifera TaxID=50390 RepID=A0ABM5L692_DIAVI|nr:uncharacterized protein LOC126892466 [Diabrotica virgifera virgifera]
MSGVPCTILVSIEDRLNFPTKMALVVIRQLFRYGLRSISLRNDRILIDLVYTPKSTTLSRKFGNLPVKYIRMQINDSNEIGLFEKAMKRYYFDLEEETEALPPPPPPTTTPSIKSIQKEPLKKKLKRRVTQHVESIDLDQNSQVWSFDEHIIDDDDDDKEDHTRRATISETRNDYGDDDDCTTTLIPPTE